MLPIGVLIPTRNSAKLMPEHLETVRQWIDQVEEVVVVDSHSTDGTVELIRSGISHPRLRFLTHPPGLYQSWNYGIQNVQAKFTYVSTVGDSIRLEGLKDLAELLDSTNADVAASKPTFVDMATKPIGAPRWPIDDVLDVLGRSGPVTLEGADLFLFALVNFREALLGSSASNLYRTASIQKLPFPTDYGTVGDAAWGLQNCFSVRMTFTPRVYSTFREHPKSYSHKEYAVDDLSGKMFNQICQTFRDALAHQSPAAKKAIQIGADKLVDLVGRRLAAQSQLEKARHSALPWICNPAAWTARLQRNSHGREITRLRQAALSLSAQS